MKDFTMREDAISNLVNLALNNIAAFLLGVVVLGYMVWVRYRIDDRLENLEKTLNDIRIVLYDQTPKN